MDEFVNQDASFQSESEALGGGKPSQPSSSDRQTHRRDTKRTSKAWDHFNMVEFGDKLRVVCMYCEKRYACSSKNHGTSNLLSHLNNKCLGYPYSAKKKQKDEPKKRDDVGSPSSKHFNGEELRRELAKMIIIDELPFIIVEGEGFKRYSHALEPRFKVPSHMTVGRDCRDIYKEEKSKLKAVLKSQRVCLTTDTWTSIQNLNYLCLTAHWIDGEWNLHKRILNFCLVPNHRGETIGKTIETCLLDWEIDHVFTITVDNASSNDGAIRYLREKTMDWRGTILAHEFIHVNCCAHIVNLVVRDGLNDLNHSIHRIRNAVRYVKSSPSRTQTFKMCMEKVKIDFNGLLCLDVETRWNSTYKMLETAIKFEKAFDRLLEEDSKYFSYFDGDKNIGPPSKKDWKIARVFVNFLKLFYIVTLRFSGSLYVTSNAFFHELMAFIDRLQSLMENGDGFLNSMAFQMKMKLEKYWENYANLNYLLFVAVVLDPRFKMAYVRFCVESVYDFIKAKEIGDKVEETLNRLYSHYLTCDPNIELGVNSSSQASDDVDLDDLKEDPILTFQYKYSKHRKGMQRLESQSEVTRYFRNL